MTQSCQTCTFYLSNGALNGVCRRYPKHHTVYTGDWCGEWREMEKKHAGPETSGQRANETKGQKALRSVPKA